MLTTFCRQACCVSIHLFTQLCSNQLDLWRLVWLALSVKPQLFIQQRVTCCTNARVYAGQTHWKLLPQWRQLLMWGVWKEISHHAASQIKCHSSKWESNWIETAILEVWVKLVSPCLIKSAVESSLVNPGRSIIATQQHYKWRPTHMFHHFGVPLTIHSLR